MTVDSITTRDLELDDLFKEKFNGAFGINISEDLSPAIDPFVVVNRGVNGKMLVFSSGLLSSLPDDPNDNVYWEANLKELILFDPVDCDIRCFNDVVDFIESYGEYYDDSIVELLGKVVSTNIF